MFYIYSYSQVLNSCQHAPFHHHREQKNSPLKINLPGRAPVCQRVPRGMAKVDVAGVAAGAGVLDGDGDGVTLAADVVTRPLVGDLDLAAALGGLVPVVHPVVSEGDDEGGVVVGGAAGADVAVLGVDCADSGVEGLMGGAGGDNYVKHGWVGGGGGGNTGERTGLLD